MKKLYIVLIIKLLITQQIAGQEKCWERPNTITTDWRSNQSDNDFNWTTEEYGQFYLKKS